MKRGGRLRTEDEPCLVQASTSPTSPRALPASRIFLNLVSNAEAATTRPAVAVAAVAARDATLLPLAPCTTWATLARAVRSILWSATPNITAPTAMATSASTSPTWPCPNACTPAASRTWLSAWWPRTVCPTKPPVGTSGVTTASSSPTPPSRTGSRPLEKKIPGGRQSVRRWAALRRRPGRLAGPPRPASSLPPATGPTPHCDAPPPATPTPLPPRPSTPSPGVYTAPTHSSR